ncbi:hypothetical protein DK104_19550 [Salmonella enterica subsp. enterica serovar Lexington]|nr:hypothetical protein [Salmonella enterica subsp. enterica serovar Weltevreden]EAM2795116.1 hypothetical protein [Salmonella enterica]EBU7426998.1 hypothetical protein [Salmonella enterica subsp. enterica serovar Lexington]EBX4401868.1 hypothetical protein [Salmonella enterica subsp. enterica serovar Typhimurium]ECD1162920.1 hypothetical protein [Salmonella enterica subsp. enterica serovar Richmond]MJF91275.1 hypothetical protein [Salmonella enterica subsp. enterica serovar Bareilly]
MYKRHGYTGGYLLRISINLLRNTFGLFVVVIIKIKILQGAIYFYNWDKDSSALIIINLLFLCSW